MGGIFLFGFMALLIVLGPAAVVAWQLRRRLDRLEKRLQALEATGPHPSPGGPSPGVAEQAADSPATAPPPTDGAAGDSARRSHFTTPPGAAASPPPDAPSRRPGLLRQLARHWMVWLGALSIGLAGVFLVRHSMEHELLGPGARIAAGLAIGLALHMAAEWLRRRTAFRSEALAALAGSASLVVYAAILAALHLYALWPPGVVFILLGVVSLATMGLALMHGPTLAILGIIGGFAVPALLGGDADQLWVVQAYALVIAAAGFALVHHVFRPWLWWSILAGALFWWWIAVLGGHPGDLITTGFYLALLAWALLALPDTDPLLIRPRTDPPTFANGSSWRAWRDLEPLLLRHQLLALGVLLAAQAWGLMHALNAGVPAWSWLALPALLLWAGRHARVLRILAWPALLASLAGLMAALLQAAPSGLPQWILQPPQGDDRDIVLGLLVGLAVLFTAAGLWTLRARAHNQEEAADLHAAPASLAFLAPLLLLAVTERSVPDALPTVHAGLAALVWGLLLLAFAADYLRRGRTDTVVRWLVIGGHLGLALAAVLILERAGLTLALGVLLLSLTGVRRHFGLPGQDWLIKLVLVVIALRLTLMPWIPGHAPDPAWIPWTYGGVFLLALLAARITPSEDRLRPWLEAGTLHLLVLFLFTGVRYLLYDGDVFTARLEFTEVMLHTLLWGSLALLRHISASNAMRTDAPQLARVNEVAAAILMGLALSAWLLLLLNFNPLFSRDAATATGSFPVFNLLWLAYAFPALLWLLGSRWFQPAWRGLLGIAAAVGAVTFVTLQVRHLWHGTVHWSAGMPDGELYSHSLAWLLIALTGLVAGILRGQQAWYRGGLILLVAVILKVFLLDLAGLSGVLRALSFLGLGLVLLGVAYLHQRMQQGVTNA